MCEPTCLLQSHERRWWDYQHVRRKASDAHATGHRGELGRDGAAVERGQPRDAPASAPPHSTPSLDRGSARVGAARCHQSLPPLVAPPLMAAEGAAHSCCTAAAAGAPAGADRGYHRALRRSHHWRAPRCAAPSARTTPPSMRMREATIYEAAAAHGEHTVAGARSCATRRRKRLERRGVLMRQQRRAAQRQESLGALQEAPARWLRWRRHRLRPHAPLLSANCGRSVTTTHDWERRLRRERRRRKGIAVDLIGGLVDSDQLSRDSGHAGDGSLAQRRGSIGGPCAQRANLLQDGGDAVTRRSRPAAYGIPFVLGVKMRILRHRRRIVVVRLIRGGRWELRASDGRARSRCRSGLRDRWRRRSAEARRR